jgi:hypothetical protein
MPVVLHATLPSIFLPSFESSVRESKLIAQANIHIYLIDDSKLGKNIEGNVARSTTGIFHFYVINLWFI